MGNALHIRWQRTIELPGLDDNEGYRLEIGESIELSAETSTGVLYGLTTLRQLANPQGQFPRGEIEDAPRFAWRGLMLDPARRFLSLDALRKVVDGLAQHKMNVLHLHLSDDQGFRFPSQAFPALASKQCYSVTELQELVAYAATRGVRIVPELDVPGHVNHWLTAYPQWGSKNQVEPSERFGVHRACLDPSLEEVYESLGVLFSELAAVFPDAYLHFGGDEVNAQWWDESETVKRLAAREGLADAPAVQAYFNRRLTRMIGELGRVPIGWDEVLHPDMPESVTVQSWRGARARDRALHSGCDTVFSSAFYLDLFYPADVHYQFDIEAPLYELESLEDGLLEDPRFEHVAGGMRWTQHWRDVPPARSAPAGRLLGGEACLWGELVDETVLPMRLWPRLGAIAERLWSKEVDSPAGFAARARRFQAHLTDCVDINVEREQRVFFDALGFSRAQQSMLALLEPVKWYARLLGETALQARLMGEEMPQARPYSATRLLDGAVDGLFAQSQAFMSLPDDHRAWAERLLMESQSLSWPSSLRPGVEAARQALSLYLAYLKGEGLDRHELRAALLKLYRPYGEVIPAVALRLSQELAG